MAPTKSRVTTDGSAFRIHISIPTPSITDAMPALHKLVDSMEELCRITLDCGTVDLTIKCKQHNCLQNNCSTIFNKVLKNRRSNNRRPKTKSRCRHVVVPFSPMNARGPDNSKGAKCIQAATQSEALAHSSNLNVGFLGSRASETICTSASVAANEMRTCEDPLDE